MGRRPGWWLGLSCGVIALAVAAVAGIGVFARGDGSVASVVSIRGVAFEMTTTGVYAWNSARVVAEGVGWDVFTLLVVAPALLVAAVLVARASFRGLLFALGVLGYVVYQYFEYAVTWAFGPLFLPFVVIVGAAMLTLLGVAALVTRDGVTGRFGGSFPRVAWSVLSVTMATLLTVSWLARIRQALDGDLAGAGLTSETTLTVQAIDLAVVVPLLVLSAALAWRRSAVGYAFVSALSVTFVGMAGAIVAMLVSAAVVEGVAEVGPIAIFGIAALAGLAVSIRAFQAVIPRGSVPATEARLHAAVW